MADWQEKEWTDYTEIAPMEIILYGIWQMLAFITVTIVTIRGSLNTFGALGKFSLSGSQKLSYGW